MGNSVSLLTFLDGKSHWLLCIAVKFEKEPTGNLPMRNEKHYIKRGNVINDQ